MSDLFNKKHKVASRLEGIIWKWNDWKVGAQFGGTYIGSHVWTSQDGKDVTAYDFADCTIDGVKMPEMEIHTFNQSYILDEIMEKYNPGQRMGIEYAGQAPPKGKKQGVRLFTPYVDPTNIDENYTRFLGGNAPVTKKFDAAEAEETAPEEPAAAAATEPPFITTKDVLSFAAGKLGVSDEAGAKAVIKTITGLDLMDTNADAVMAVLKVKVGA